MSDANNPSATAIALDRLPFPSHVIADALSTAGHRQWRLDRVATRGIREDFDFGLWWMRGMERTRWSVTVIYDGLEQSRVYINGVRDGVDGHAPEPERLTKLDADAAVLIGSIAEITQVMLVDGTPSKLELDF